MSWKINAYLATLDRSRYRVIRCSKWLAKEWKRTNNGRRSETDHISFNNNGIYNLCIYNDGRIYVFAPYGHMGSSGLEEVWIPREQAVTS